LKHKQYVKM